MKILLVSIFAVVVVLSQPLFAKNLSVDQQIEIIANYMRITGQGDKIPSTFVDPERFPTDLERPDKCGMAAAMEFSLNRNDLDKNLATAMGLSIQQERPELTYSYDSPEGLYKIHYETTGDDAVYQSEVDSDGDGVPDYIENVAIIFDSVYNHIINILGYPVPPDDGIVGGDSRYDIYIVDIDLRAYGFTSSFDPSRAIDSVYRIYSYIVLDNDYQNISPYKYRPLDAVRVTAAHEFFHAIHFGIDFREYEQYITNTERRYWMEMSAVWMEDDIYDEINDYYSYLDSFFINPGLSIQQFVDFGDIRPYGTVVFPKFLSEKFDRDIIRDIWLGCGNHAGPNFLLAMDSVLDLKYFNAYRDDTSAFPQVFNEFAVWNFFTDLRSDMAPPGIGYLERHNYPPIPNVMIAVYDDLPDIQYFNNIYNPDHNAAAYIKIDQLQAFQRFSYWVDIPGDSLAVVDTSHWECNIYICHEFDTVGCYGDPFDCCIDSSCYDSSQVYDTLEGYDWQNIRTIWYQDSCEITDTMGTRFRYVDAFTDEVRDTVIAAYDYVQEDSIMSIGIALDGSFYRQWGTNPAIIYGPWGVTQLMQYDSNRENIDTVFTLISDTNVVFNYYNPEQYHSITFVITPASELKEKYEFSSFTNRGNPKKIGMSIRAHLVDSLRDSHVDYSARNVPSEILVAYPNPAVVPEMTNDYLRIQYQIPTDNSSFYIYENPRLTMDIYNIAGEYVRFIDTNVVVDPINIYVPDERTVVWEAQWDMKNASGSDVASGVYIIVARIYSDVEKGKLLTEKTTKVVIIR